MLLPLPVSMEEEEEEELNSLIQWLGHSLLEQQQQQQDHCVSEVPVPI